MSVAGQRQQQCTSGEYAVQDSCKQCPIGQYQDVDEHPYTQCKQCMGGKYQSETGKDTCIMCQAGQQSSLSNSACLDCPSGTFNDKEGTTTCTTCPAGWFSGTPFCSDSSSITQYDCLYEQASNTSWTGICQNGDQRVAAYSKEDCRYYDEDNNNIWMGDTCDNSIHQSKPDCIYKRTSHTWTIQRSQCTACPIGYSQPSERSSNCVNCAIGYHQHDVGSVRCDQCALGKFGTIAVNIPECQNCPTGQYQNEYAMSSCQQCNEGQYTVDEMSTSCSDCPRSGNCCVGWGLDSDNVCKQCPLGSVGLNNSCSQCPPGSVSILGQECRVCSEPSERQTMYVIDENRCQPHCSFGKINVSGYCQSCTVGTYIKKTTYNNKTARYDTVCTECDAGQYTSETGQLFCTPCAAGTHTNGSSGQLTCTNCPLGKKSRSGQSICQEQCNEYSHATGTDQCSTCSPGYHYSEQCSLCPIGWMKSEIVISPAGQCVQCPAGQESDSTRTHCLCPAGQELGLFLDCQDCPSGKVGSLSSCDDCSPGTYTSVPGQDVCSTCLAGQYQEKSGQSSCVDCPIGWWNNSGTTCRRCITSVDCQNCDLGEEQILENEQYTCQKCHRGKYSSVVGGVCVYCPLGQYQSDIGQHQCQYCPSGTSSVNSIYDYEGFTYCLPGTICDPGHSLTNGHCTLCQAGQYSVGGLNAVCRHCGVGHVPGQQQTNCQKCEAGRQATVSHTCELCPNGWAGDPCQACPIGFIPVEEQTIRVCVNCEWMKTTLVVGSTTCVDCSSKFDFTQNGVCRNCGPGQYMTQGGTTENHCQTCPPGQRLDQGNTCVTCQSGKYRDTDDKLYCHTCPVGYSDVITRKSCMPCLSDCDGQCAAGEYSDNGQCTKCEPGKVSGGGQQNRCFFCAAGTAQPSAGQASCENCEPGKFSDQLANSHCKLCPTGQFQHTAKNAGCADCGEGKYSATKGSTGCSTCEQGKFVDTPSSDSMDDCKACPIGWHGLVSGQCTQCPESTYQDQQGMSDCIQCTGTSPLSQPAATQSSDCFDGSGLVTYVFDIEDDSKNQGKYTATCEIRPNMVLLCPGCSCKDNSRDGYWDGPVCDECMHGFAGGNVGKCLIKCPGYDGVHDSTMCSGNGKCWYGKHGSGECLCGGKNILDASSNNIVVDVKTCSAGQICPGYGADVLENTQYRPFYYILEYRQYSVFVLQLNLYTPTRGHMWFERYSRQTIYENSCATCTGSYDGTEYTQIGYLTEDSTDYTMFDSRLQVNNGFHGENCQYECAICLNSGECLHTPHPFYYSYTIDSEHHTVADVFLPQTQCICSSDIYDADAMCCPHGFEPYVYFGKRTIEPYFYHTALPLITNIVNSRPDYWTDKDLWLQGIYPPYEAPSTSTITVSNLNFVYSDNGQGNQEVNYFEHGPYTKHTFYGTEKDICRACPGLFGKGVVSRSKELTSEKLAEDFWWDSAAKGKKCNGLGVCNFYLQQLESDILFMGEYKVTSEIQYKQHKRFTSCQANTAKNTAKIGNYLSIEQCIAAAGYTSGIFQFVQPYHISGYISGQTISIVGAQTDTPQTKTSPWGYVQNKSNVTFELNQIFPSLPVPDASGEWLFHPWAEGDCFYHEHCDEIPDKLNSLYIIGQTGQGDDRLPTATFDRFDTCFTYDDGTFKTKIGHYISEEYINGQDPFIGKNCPRGHFCTKHGDVGFKEACPAGYYQPDEAVTRSTPGTMCSRLDSVDDGCQLNEATADTYDFVDKVCRRCPRNEYAKPGSAACTACPAGRVKKISNVPGDQTINDLTMYNMPSNLDAAFTPWYYMPFETGQESDDCALVPNGIVHIPNLDIEMTYDRPEFLPVVACPYGYSSRPGTYVIWGQDKLTQDIKMSALQNKGFLTAPFVQRPYDTLSSGNRPLALDYCFQCPTNSITSAGSMTCATCFANQVKIYLKDALVKMVELNELPDISLWEASELP